MKCAKCCDGKYDKNVIAVANEPPWWTQYKNGSKRVKEPGCIFVTSDMLGFKEQQDPLLDRRIGIHGGSTLYGRLVELFLKANRNHKNIPAAAFKDTEKGEKIIIGVVSKVKLKAPKGKTTKTKCYEIVFDNTTIPMMEVDAAVVQVMIEKYTKYEQHVKCSNDYNLTSEAEDGNHNTFNVEEKKEDSEEEELCMGPYRLPLIRNSNNRSIPEEGILIEEETASGEKIACGEGLNWEFGKRLQPSNNVYNGGDTHFKAEYENSPHFESPINSLLSFIPMEYWKKMLSETNVYAQKLADDNNGFISGRPWTRKFSLNEIMKFHGLLMLMTIVPYPGRKYEYYWETTDTRFHKVTRELAIKRFVQLRRVLRLYNEQEKKKSRRTMLKILTLLLW